MIRTTEHVEVNFALSQLVILKSFSLNGANGGGIAFTFYGDLKKPVYDLADSMGWKVIEEA